MSKTSFIIPFYKGEQFIVPCVESILKVRHEKEILIVDDGSPYDSNRYCKCNFADMKEVILLTKENGGIASARNYGIENSSGDYLIFVDQDDLVIPETIETAINIMKSSSSSVVFWETSFYNNNGNKKDCDRICEDAVVEKKGIKDKILPFFFKRNDTPFGSFITHVWAGIYDAKLIKNKKIRFHYFIDYEDDYVFLADFLSIANKVSFLNKEGYLWRTNNLSYSHQYRCISDYLSKARQLYEYILTKSREGGLSNIETIKTYWIQRIIINSIRNCTCSKELDRIQYRELLEYLKTEEGRSAFQRPFLQEKDFRLMLLYYCVRYRFCGIIPLITRIYFLIKH